jgi:ABC-2 type transport system permease protein
MDKLWLIIQREFLSRVTKRAFILGTFLTPLGIGALIFFNIKLAMYKDDNKKKIAIIDESGMLTKAPENQQNISFVLSKSSLEQLKALTVADTFQGVLVIPPLKDFVTKRHTVKFYSDDRLGNDMTSDIEKKVSDAIKAYKVDSLKLDTAKLQALNTRIEIDPEPIKNTENASSKASDVATMIGFAMGFFMYMAVFIYGMMVFRSVMEEKTTRIVEVMISSVKPFQLMLGKIIGVGAAGLVQLVVWIILMAGISVSVPLMMGGDASKIAQMNQQGMPGGAGMQNMPQMDFEGGSETAKIMMELQHQNWWLILPLFIVFFLLGYVLYSSLFAAVGSAVGDDAGESQSLTLPITLPVILAIYIMFAAVRAPDSSLAVWSSIFPLFSPIVMPARLPFHPPVWQIIASLVALIATVIFFVWLAARIYRVGILMYGKKVTFKELGKWLFYKD